MKHDFHLGLRLLYIVIEDSNKAGYVPRLVFKNNLNEASRSVAMKTLISTHDFHHKIEWQLAYYDYLDQSLIEYQDTTDILSIMRGIVTPVNVQFGGLVKFIQLRPSLFNEILEIIVHKNQFENNRMSLWMDFFDENFDYLNNDFELIKKAYLQQIKIQNYLDFESKGLKKILSVSPEFIVDYFETLYVDEVGSYSHDSRNFGFIWDIDNIEVYVLRIFDLYIEKNIYYGISEVYLNTLFQNINEQQKIKADQFLIDFLISNSAHPKKVNLIVDITRNSRKELFSKILLTYVELNQNVKDFSEIWWRGNGGTYSGDVVIGDIEAADWRNILSILEKSNLGIRLLPIKKYVSDTIASCLRSGDWERKQRFIERY
ncbi:hypothetical protein [Pedobacter steynii]